MLTLYPDVRLTAAGWICKGHKDFWSYVLKAKKPQLIPVLLLKVHPSLRMRGLAGYLTQSLLGNTFLGNLTESDVLV